MNITKKISFKTINAVLIFLIVAVFLAVLAICYRSLLQIDADEYWEIHSYQVTEKINVVLSNLENIETGTRGFVITGDESFLQPYTSGLADVHKSFQALQSLTADNTLQQKSLTEMQPLIDAKIAQSDENISLRRNQGFVVSEASVITGKGKLIMDSIRVIVAKMQKEESRLLLMRTNDLIRINSITELIIIWGGIIGLLFYLLISFVINKFVIGEIVQKPLLEEALKANKEMEAFSYSVSHDLRAPLRAIDGFTQMLVEDHGEKLDDEGKRISSIIRASTVQMGKLIDDLLSFSRLGRKEIAKNVVSMKTLVNDLYTELKKTVPERNIEFIVKEIPDAKADVDMMRVVWTNLLSNALKFTGKKEKAVIEVGNTDGNDITTYFVKDNGAGFDMKYVAKLFGVFQRLHSTEEFEGTGIGLANVKRIVERHGGKVWAEGEIGEGATIYFTLPKE